MTKVQENKANGKKVHPKLKPKPRLRMVEITIQPVLMLDDGESLTSIPINPATFPASELDKLPEQLREQISVLEKQLTEEQEKESE